MNMNFQEAQRQAHQKANQSKTACVVVSLDETSYQVHYENVARERGLEFRYTANPQTVMYSEYTAECRAAGEAVMSLKEWKREGSLSLVDWKIKHALALSKKSKIKVAKKEGGKASTPVSRPNSGATKRVWDIADRLTEGNAGGKSDRADIIAACVEDGINPATAATQYSKWKRARHN